MTDGSKEGLYVQGFLPGSIAEKAGVKVGDVIFSVNDMPVNNVSDYVEAHSCDKSGMNLVLLRSNKIIEISYSFKDKE